MPDALSKTIPIWCCVLNRALFPDHPEFHNLYVAPNAVSDSEKSQMLARIPEGLNNLHSLNLDLAALRAQISRPIRPAWVTQETDLGHYHATTATTPIFASFHPVVCCTASKRAADGEMSGRTGYVQGAGDDTENWAHGLEPPVFWAHAAQLLATPEPDLPDLIEALVAASKQPPPRPLANTTNGSTTTPTVTTTLPPSARHLTPYLSVCALPLPSSLPSDTAWYTIALSAAITAPETWAKAPTHMDAGLGKHKAASRKLRDALAEICRGVTQFLQAPANAGPNQQHKRILIACETGGKDLAVGVALAMLCWAFEDDEGATVRRIDEAKSAEETAEMLGYNKQMIKVRLGRIMMVMPEANPNRATLQSVNSFLMDWRK